MSKKEVKLKGTMEKALVISILEEILSSMKKGQLTLQSGEESFSLMPSSELKMEIKAKSEKYKEKIEIELSWQKNQKPAPTIQNSIICEKEEQQHDQVPSENSSVRPEQKNATSNAR
jgi:amphi-Trp domain-containing protein